MFGVDLPANSWSFCFVLFLPGELVGERLGTLFSGVAILWFATFHSFIFLLGLFCAHLGSRHWEI
jgi:hypothetical protein